MFVLKCVAMEGGYREVFFIFSHFEIMTDRHTERKIIDK